MTDVTSRSRDPRPAADRSPDRRTSSAGPSAPGATSASLKVLLGYALVTLVLLVGVAFLFPGAGVEISFPEGMPALRIEQGRIDVASLIDSIFVPERAGSLEHEGAIARLERFGLFHVDDRDLPPALAGLVPALDLRHRPNVEALNDSLSRHPAVARLRELASGRRAPFQPIAAPALLSVPGCGVRPPMHYVHVKASSPWRGGRVELINYDQGRRLTLQASSRLDENATIDFHLNARQASYLLNDVIERGGQDIFVLGHPRPGPVTDVGPDGDLSESHTDDLEYRGPPCQGG